MSKPSAIKGNTGVMKLSAAGPTITSSTPIKTVLRSDIPGDAGGVGFPRGI